MGTARLDSSWKRYRRSLRVQAFCRSVCEYTVTRSRHVHPEVFWHAECGGALKRFLYREVQGWGWLHQKSTFPAGLPLYLILKVLIGLLELTSIVSRSSRVLLSVKKASSFRRRSSPTLAQHLSIGWLLVTQSRSWDHGVSVTERVGGLIISTSWDSRLAIRRQHAHPLFFERVLVLCLDRSIYDTLEHLYD